MGGTELVASVRPILDVVTELTCSYLRNVNPTPPAHYVSIIQMILVE
jgi:hypothetical protein